MQQPKMPATGQSTDNTLESVVRILPVNASTIAEIQTPKQQLRTSLPPATLPGWNYRIGSGDVLNIVVWDHPQITNPAGEQRTPEQAGRWVSPQGTIFYPYIGDVEVGGLTIAEVRRKITRGLQSVIPVPQVDVSVARFAAKKAQITGAVVSPGPVSITHIPVTLLDAIDAREGSVAEADLDNITLIRQSRVFVISLREYKEAGNIRSNPQLQDGDIVVIPRNENNEVYVLGEVENPGIVPLGEHSLSLTEALAASEGLSKSTANASGIFVFRAVTEEKRIDVYQLDITDPTALLLGTRFRLGKGDVVYVTSAPAARWNRLISNIIPSLGALNTLLLIEERN